MGSLTKYRRKRDFNATNEPRGDSRPRTGRAQFVVQKHRATRLHYDLRLELDGVLKSWAVPKGPSLVPGQKRLAIEVDDHPLEYAKFEGLIPKGEYGGGTVLIWDQGRWNCDGDAGAHLRAGKLKFTLFGEKLNGGWMLVRIAGQEPNQWLLIKERDEHARTDNDPDVLVERPASVTSGRDLEQIAAGERPIPKRSLPSRNGKKSARNDTSPANKKSLGASRKTVKPPPLPKPQLATLAKNPPDGPEWLHEIKFDGYRMLCQVHDGSATLISRNGLDWTDRFATVADAAARLPVREVVLDGEIVVLAADGRSSFQALQNALRAQRRSGLLYFVFDLLSLDGRDLSARPLAERKRRLAELLSRAGKGPIRLSEHLEGDGQAFFEAACEKGLEGIISKRADRAYRPGRGPEWIKVKCTNQEEFVIGGFTPPQGARTGFGALAVGYFDPSGQLRYAGRVGTGFDERTLVELTSRLNKLQRIESPFSDLRGRSGEARGVHWVAPKLVAQVAFGEWTSDGRLRHPSFLGLREDKPPRQVVRRERLAPETNSPAASGNERQPAPASAPAGVRLTHPERVYYPEVDLTKAALAEFYVGIADWILPHLVDRPLSIVRCPDGIHKPCFFQKHPGPGVSEHLRRIRIKEKDATRDYLVVDDVAGLVSLVQIGGLEIHVWGCRTDRIETPDRIVFDLDPDESVPWPRVVQAALAVRTVLEGIGLESFIKTTGGKGLHIVVPVVRRHDWSAVRRFTQGVVRALTAAEPKAYTSSHLKAARRGKIFIDEARNRRGATAIVAYSTRAKPNAPVSTPLDWSELTGSIRADKFTVENLVERLSKLRRDPWQEMSTLRQSIPATAWKKLGV